MKIPNRSAIFIALSAIVCLSVVGMRVFAQSGSARSDAFTLTFSNAKLKKHADDPSGFEGVLKNAHAHYCVRHTDSNDRATPMNDPATSCNLQTASVNNDHSEIILVDDQAPASSSIPNTSIKGPSVTQKIGTSSAVDMTTVLGEFQ